MRILYALTFYNKVCILKSVQGTHYTDALVSSTGCLYHTSMDDTHIMKSVPTTNYYSATVMYMGRWASYPARIMMQFVFTDVLKNAIAPSSITEAKLYLWDQSTDTTRRTVNVRIPRNIWTASTVTWNTAPSYYTGTWNGIPAPTSHTISGDPGWWAFPYMKDVVAAMLRNYIDTSLAQTIHEKRGIMIKLADETVGLKTLRSSNHSENRPNMSITYYAHNSYGAAPPYVQKNGTVPNCLGYALSKDISIVSYYKSPTNNDAVQSDATMVNWIIGEISPYANVRAIGNKNSSVNSNEYRIAFRVGKKPKLNMEWGKPEGYIIQEYHFIMQNNTGGWAHKLNTSPSVYLGDINPDNNSTAWSYPIGIVGDSITGTKYLAVIP